MSQLKELLVEELQDLLHAEMQLTKALPEMAAAAHNTKLKEAFKNTWSKRKSTSRGLKRYSNFWARRLSPRPARRCKV